MPALHQGIRQLDESSPEVSEVERLLTESFTGSTTVPGEGGLSWAFDPIGNVDGDPCKPLKVRGGVGGKGPTFGVTSSHI